MNASAADAASGVWDVGSSFAHFAQIKDKRDARGLQYSVAMMLTLTMLAKLGGQNTPAGIADYIRHRGEWLSEMLACLGIKCRRKRDGRIKLPCAGSYSRILSTAFAAADLEQVAHQFMTCQADQANPQANPTGSAGIGVEICIDGKKIRGTVSAVQPNGIYLLAAYQPSLGVVLMQVLIQPGEGELTVAPTVLKALNLQGKVITGDALFAQRQLSLQIVQAGGDYVWKVKGNQPTLEAQIANLFAPQAPAKPGFSNPKTDFRSTRQTSAAHGRFETRTLTTSSLLQGYSDWPHLQQVFKYDCLMLDATSGHRTFTTTYGATSLSAAQADPKRLLHIVRGHWRIENGLHYRRDVLLHEDGCDLRLPQLAYVFAILNNWVLGLVALRSGGNVAAAQRLFCARPDLALDLILRL